MPLRGELDRVAEQVGQHLAQLALVGAHVAWNITRLLEGQRQALVMGAQAESIFQALHQAVQVKFLFLQRDAPGLDLRDLQHVVDDGQQVLAAAVDRFQVLALRRGQVGVTRQQLAEAQDGVERRAQLVAHVGQENALGLVGGLCRFFGFLQSGLSPVAVVHIADRFDRPDDMAL